MARFDVRGIEPILKDMARLQEQTGPVADAMLMAAAGVVRQEWIYAIERHRHRKSRDMMNSVGYPRRPKTAGDIRTIDIYPQGVDRRGIRNAEKAFIAHYGRVHQTGSGFVDEADRNSEQPVMDVMTRIWDQYLESGSVKTEAVENWHAGEKASGGAIGTATYHQR